MRFVSRTPSCTNVCLPTKNLGVDTGLDMEGAAEGGAALPPVPYALSDL